MWQKGVTGICALTSAVLLVLFWQCVNAMGREMFGMIIPPTKRSEST